MSKGIWDTVQRGPSLLAMDGLLWSLQVPRDETGLDQRWDPGGALPPELGVPLLHINSAVRTDLIALQGSEPGRGQETLKGQGQILNLTSPEAPPLVPAGVLGELGDLEWKC